MVLAGLTKSDERFVSMQRARNYAFDIVVCVPIHEAGVPGASTVRYAILIR
jgi:hypothetical protein